MVTEYVLVAGETWPVNTPAEVDAACAALSEASQNEAKVWRSSHSLERVLELGDPDAYETHHVLLADRDVDPKANGTAP